MAETVLKRAVMIMAIFLLPSFYLVANSEVPETEIAALAQQLQGGQLESRLQALSVVQERCITALDEPLRKIAFDPKQPNALRLEAVAAIAPRLSPVDLHLSELVRSNLSAENPPLLRLTAARTLARLRLSDRQMLSVAKSVGEADSLILPTLVGAFSHTSNDAAGLSLVIALGRTPGKASLSADELAHVLRHYSVGVRTAARPLLELMGVDLDKQRSHLEELAPALEGGDAGRGKAIFSSKKANCAACHNTIGSEPGGLPGPNLSQVGKQRSGMELLDSLIYPSASSVPGFESFKVETTDGQSVTGMIFRERPDAVWIRARDAADKKIETNRIKTLEAHSVTLMPKGIEDALTKDEMRDLLAYLRSLK